MLNATPFVPPPNATEEEQIAWLVDLLCSTDKELKEQVRYLLACCLSLSLGGSPVLRAGMHSGGAADRRVDACLQSTPLAP